MKKLFLIVAALFVAVSFSACSDDEDDGGGNAISIVSQIIQQDEDGGTMIWKFDYDNQGRVTKMTHEDEYTLFSYSSNYIDITEHYSGNDLNYKATLNSKGYIASITETDRETGAKNTTNYEYNSNGYLIKETWTGETGYLQCTWNNGDLINEHRTGTDPMDYNYEYTSHIAKQNIDLFAFMYGYCHVDDPDFLGVSGLLGKKSAHLIKSSTSQEDANNTFDYELDGNGNPIKVTMTSEYETTIYKILYK